MRGKAHLATGLITGLTLGILTLSDSTGVGGMLSLAAASAVGSLAPDMDLPTSTVGKKVKPIAIVINKMFGHRTITHAPLWIIPLVILYIMMPKFLTSPNIPIWQSALLGYIAGYICHLIGDILTKGGIPLLYPFSKKRVHLTNIESGAHDVILSIIVIVTIILLEVAWINL